MTRRKRVYQPIGEPMGLGGARTKLVPGQVCTGDGAYLMVYLPNHPNATKRGKVLLHRWVVEQKLGRFLRPDEDVDHTDGNKRNNDPDNLLALPHILHRKAAWGGPYFVPN